jgi:protein phosphatase
VTGFEICEQAGRTDVGVRRSHNQDAFAVVTCSDLEAWRERGHLFLVADGMGGHAVGELASKLAVDLIPHTYQKHARQGVVPALRRAFSEANASIHQRGRQNQEFEGMGTTSSALLLRPDGAWIAHIGDSRIYRVRAGRIEQLTFDHSEQWELARRLGVDPEQIQGVPHNRIFRSLGPEAQAQVDIEGPHPVLPGDAYLLCSDGLSNQVSDREMGAIFSVLPADEACPLLIDLANLRGGPDNITAILVRLPGTPPDGAEPPAARPPRPRRGWSLRLPWAALGLGAGISLAVLALVLVILGRPQLSVATFVLAALTLGAGLFGLYRQVRRETLGVPAPNPQDESRPPRVYRQTSCRIDKDLVDQLAQTTAQLEEQARAKNWQVAWPAYREHHDAARAALARNDPPAAFREQCLALAVLTAAMRRHRSKGEVFQPLWEGAD